jgi:transcription elongation GreA/GreB family factor
MNKQQLVEQFIEQLLIEAANLATAAKTAHADATGEESKSENKYDTRGLEASYLAGAQAKMAAESIQNIACYKTLALKDFTSDSKISITAFIELESEDSTRSFYFLGPKGGGTKIEFDGKSILLITPSSPIGGQLISRRVGDCISIQVAGNKKEYEVIAIC